MAGSLNGVNGKDAPRASTRGVSHALDAGEGKSYRGEAAGTSVDASARIGGSGESRSVGAPLDDGALPANDCTRRTSGLPTDLTSLFDERGLTCLA